MTEPVIQTIPNVEGAQFIAPGQTYTTVTDKIASIVESPKYGKGWLIIFTLSVMASIGLLVAVLELFARGIGIWGVNIPVAWGFAIANFVWWIGMGHAGTLISAILLLLHQEWRTSINRFAEAMTLFAVMCAGMFPLLHLGRPKVFYWLIPYPNTMALWPQFRSPLVWDVFAVGTYFTISLIFWYVGLIPDLATMRDRAKTRLGQVVWAVFSLGWRGSAKHWKRYHQSYVLLAALATPLVISVHTVVSFDFAVAQLPGWHSTIFPPYFVAGAIYSGFAMVLTLMIPLRWGYGLQGLITEKHLDVMGKVTLATGLIVAYGYMMETFMIYYSGNVHEVTQTNNRLWSGPYAWVWWLVFACNVAIPQLLWFKKFRISPWKMFLMSLVINLGMWLERFMIVVGSLSRNFIPSKWHMYYPTTWDWLTLIGTIGFFFMCFLLFVRFVPMIPIFEMRGMVARTSGTKEPAESVAEEGRVAS